MSEQKTDRRIRRTRRELENALIRLLKEKNIQSISVKELCEEADVTRSTFYQHYSNPYDMLTEIQDRIMDQVQEIINTTTGGDSYGFFLHIFSSHIQLHHPCKQRFRTYYFYLLLYYQPIHIKGKL